MFKNKNILLTGSTGQLGSYLLKEMLGDKLVGSQKIFLIIRGEDVSVASERLRESLRFVFNSHRLNSRFFQRLQVFCGDISRKNFGLTASDYQNLLDNTNVLYHCAANVSFGATLRDLRPINVNGTRNILKFIKKGKNVNELHYVSTAFVAGDHVGRFGEDDFNVSQRFNNPYEQSKYESEFLVRGFKKNNLRVSIYRPSILIGEFSTGRTSSFQMFYQPLRLLTREVFDEIPINTKTVLNLMPADIAAKAIYVLSRNIDKDFNVYHIVNPEGVNIVDLINFSRKYFKFKKPNFTSKLVFKTRKLSFAHRKLIEPYVSYFNFPGVFDCAQTLKQLTRAAFIPPKVDQKFLMKIFSFAEGKGFLKRKENRN